MVTSESAASSPSKSDPTLPRLRRLGRGGMGGAALGIMKPPHRDRPLRPVSMVAAHLVFGSVLGAFVDRFTPAAQK